MRLYLVQHGQALTKDIDPDRPLSPDGEKEVQSIAAHMHKKRILLNRIYHSGKMRAHQSAELFADTLLVSGEVMTIEGINPNDPVAAFAGNIPELHSDTMIVGHLPFIAKLASLLVTGKDDPLIVSYKPGSVVCLLQDEHKHWHIGWMLRPDCA